MKPSTVSNTSEIDEVPKHFDHHSSACKIKKAFSEILREDNFKIVSMDEVKKVLLRLNTQKNLPCMVPSLQVS